MLNEGLTVEKAPAEARSGLGRIQVVPLTRGTPLYRYGSPSGPWWILEAGHNLILRLAFTFHQELDLMQRINSRETAQALVTRKHLAVLHEWNKLDHLVKAEVVKDILVYVGSGKPMKEEMPNGFRLIHDCPTIPQIYVPNFSTHAGAIKVHSVSKMHGGRTLW